ncbi:phosphoribosylanthranilate isomerase [Gammaproteobacteria bacterium]|jgi:phosphoribosylanthranilate isomerase|nr:phosphoribosylanthranilate isomerase [Gammaproteobacteria bacterium]|tara:strand:+ start:489 stop:1115 length:627 start_codon:yes stop_codon:yes gene_type:complete
MNSPKVKICGISNIEILKTLISLDLDFIGFIFYSKSPRYVDTKFLQSIEDIDFKDSRPVCVYVNAEEDYIYETSSYFNNPILQFHGDEENNFCESFGLDYWKAIRVKDKEDLETISLYNSAQAILLENHKEGSYGGTGESFNWTILKDIENDDQNFVLSGGINSQNVDNALKTNSWCLDLNSGVESQEGIKNIELVKDILKTIETYGI